MLLTKIGRHQIHIGERFSMSFRRTLRVPDDGNNYPLPPGLGYFDVHSIDEFSAEIPNEWKKGQTAFIGMHEFEAMWLDFQAAHWKPNAVKIGIGQINAISGSSWNLTLQNDPQDYLVCPNQPWLDGVNVGKGIIRQFIATPLGSGSSIEAQLGSSPEYGGIEIVVFDPKPGFFAEQPPPEVYMDLSQPGREMTLAVSGKIKQKIYPDPYGIHVWNPDEFGSISIRILNSAEYRRIVGSPLPDSPITAETYTQAGLPWFVLADDELSTLETPEKFKKIKSVRPGGLKKDRSVKIKPTQLKKLKKANRGN